MGQANTDIGFFQETKLTNGIYTHISAGSMVVRTLGPITHHGGVTLLYWHSPRFVVEAICQFGANIITCQLERGRGCWYIIRCNLVPVDRATIWDVETAMNERPRGVEFISVGYLTPICRGREDRDGKKILRQWWRQRGWKIFWSTSFSD